ncbi:MAG: hypothetical protein EOO86_09790 [Pedobacter sp.]|nr:MAG: hypothetical protein EOO86_09790 [Pedobacter sp.]
MNIKVNLSCSVQLWINKRRIKKDGEVRLYLRISVENHLPRDIKLRYFWPVEFFDEKKKEIKKRSKNDPDFVSVCAYIESERAKYWTVVKKFTLNDEYFTPEDIVRAVWYTKLGDALGTFIRFRSRERVKEQLIKPHTRDNHISTANQLDNYKNKDVRISDVSKRWLELYMSHLMESMAYSGAWSHIKNIRTYIHEAKRKGIAIHTTFESFKLEKPDPDPVWLERDELTRIIELYQDDTTNPMIRDYMKAFLFSSFTGLRVSDLKRFDLSWIVGNEIVFEPMKKRLTSKKPHVVRIPIIDVAKQFLVNLGNNDKLMERSDVKYNKNLKTIAKLAGIDKNLTSHVARHTFGTLLALQNTPIAVIANLLGHKTMKSTMVYIHIAEKSRMNEMMRLQNSFSGFVVHRNAKTLAG